MIQESYLWGGGGMPVIGAEHCPSNEWIHNKDQRHKPCNGMVVSLLDPGMLGQFNFPKHGLFDVSEAIQHFCCDACRPNETHSIQIQLSWP